MEKGGNNKSRAFFDQASEKSAGMSIEDLYNTLTAARYRDKVRSPLDYRVPKIREQHSSPPIVKAGPGIRQRYPTPSRPATPPLHHQHCASLEQLVCARHRLALVHFRLEPSAPQRIPTPAIRRRRRTKPSSADSARLMRHDLRICRRVREESAFPCLLYL